MNFGQALEKLKEQRAQIEARIKRIESKEKSQERKRETRKKIIVGGYFLDRMKNDAGLQTQVMTDLEKRLNRNLDRDVFGFELKEDAGTEAQP